MTVMLDLNVLLDVILKREPHYSASASVLALIAEEALDGRVPAHAVTTVHYIVAKYASHTKADEAVDWLLARTSITPADRGSFLRARALSLTDFEDAVVAALAEKARCDYIASRNVPDFEGSPVPAVTPEELLALLERRGE